MSNIKPSRYSKSPTAYDNRDFFEANLLDFALKSDKSTMEMPFFSLSTKPDLRTFEWSSQDGLCSIKIIPSTMGRATQLDKDILIYLISQYKTAENWNRKDISRRIRFVVHHYLKATKKNTSGREYTRIENALLRLRGTTITTNIKTGGVEFKQGFGLIESWKIIEKPDSSSKMIAVEVVLSEWLYNAIQSHDVLKLNSEYFQIRSPLERRIYEIARKHTGQQLKWTIGLALLQSKIGSTATPSKFRHMLIKIALSNKIPEYKIEINLSRNQVEFYKKDVKQRIQAKSK